MAPNFSMPANSLQLGDIVVNPLDLELVPLNRKTRLKVPDDDLSPVGIVEKFSATRQKLLSGRFGLWTTFLASLGIPVSADLGLFLERNSKDVINAGELHTHEFIATDEYIGDVLKQDVIKMYLEDFNYHKSLYMITGLKIARGASVHLDDSVKIDAKLGITLPEAVADVRPVIQIIRNRTDGISFTSKTDFILAFRVRKVIYAGGKVRHELSLKGTSMLDGDAMTGVETDLVGTIGDDYSREEARKEADEEEFEVQVLNEDDESGEVETVAAHLHNGTVLNLAFVRAKSDYTALMARLVNSPNAPPLKRWSKWRRSINKKLGRPATTDVGTLAEMFASLRDAASTALAPSSPFDRVAITTPPIPGLADYDLIDALEYASLRPWVCSDFCEELPYADPGFPFGPGVGYPEELTEANAVMAAHGLGLCKNYDNLDLCFDEEQVMPLEKVMVVGLTEVDLRAEVIKTQGSFPMFPDGVDRFVDLMAGLNARDGFLSEEAFWAYINGRLKVLGLARRRKFDAPSLP
ncbi:hypothetical protein Neosp_014937 [[Neocosmospora] mangrovei]